MNIIEELANVMPSLDEPELALLTKSLLSEGWRDPLVVWEGVIVDGHTRYRICRENDIPFIFVEKSVAD